MKLLFSVWSFIILVNCLSAQTSITYKEEIEAYRKHYKDDFLTDPRSPLKKKDLKYLQFYDPDPNFNVLAIFTPDTSSMPFEMPTYSGKTKTFISYGKLDFNIDNIAYKLTVYRNLKLAEQAEYKDYLFIPFKDLTSGKETYGGGRYIDIKVQDIDKSNVVKLDFNKCYNPYCAFSDGYNCPVPPSENHLPVEIKAGEKRFGKSH